MTIKLLVFKDEDTKDAVTYQSWCWDLTVYHCVGCQDCTLLPYVIHLLQDYLGELVRSLGMDITLDDILTILDKHYNNVKAFDSLNQELFQLHMGEKRDSVQLGSVSIKTPTDSWNAFSQTALLNGSAIPKWLKAMVASLKASVNEKTYSDYLWVVREVEKEKAMEPSHSQTTNKPSKPKATSFFPLWKLKGTQPTKIPAIRVVHLEEEGSEEEADAESEDPDGIEGVTEEFIVCLARVVKDIQKDEKQGYHCNSTDHFICQCPLVKASRSATHLNWKEGTVPEKGAKTPQVKATKLKVPQKGTPKA